MIIILTEINSLLRWEMKDVYNKEKSKEEEIYLPVIDDITSSD